MADSAYAEPVNIDGGESAGTVASSVADSTATKTVPAFALNADRRCRGLNWRGNGFTTESPSWQAGKDMRHRHVAGGGVLEGGNQW